MPTALFLFAHPDDEFGVYQCLDVRAQAGTRIFCAYLTDGGARAAAPQRRHAESLTVLAQFGIAAEQIDFAGTRLGIPDMKLPEHLDKIARWLEHWLAAHGAPDEIFMPAWEGGHHDHDGLHAIALTTLDRQGLLQRARQFPLYHGYRCPAPWFKVLAPLAANGQVQSAVISWKHRLRYVRHCLGYPSQWRSWVGLFPFVAWHYLRHGTQCLQPVSTKRLNERPHDGPLYYEQRQFYTWESMQAALERARTASA